MKNKYIIFLSIVILNLIAVDVNSQIESTINKNENLKSLINSYQESGNTNEDSLINKTIDELIKERQIASDLGYSTMEYDYKIENQINNNVSSGNLKAAPANDNCSNATIITVGNPLICNQTTQSASLQAGETICGSVAGASAETVWYRFTASNDSLVVSFILTNNANCYPFIGIFGPFNAGTGCLPVVGNNLFCQYMGFVDPGFHKLITGLTIGKDYLISIQGSNCGGPNDRFSKFCIGVASPAVNTTASGSQLIDKCGANFSGNTNIGNYPSGSSLGSNNLDNNLLTTVTGASQTGDDVNFVINNDSWFKFCPLNGGTWQITLNGITNCTLPSPPNQGIQAAIFTGDPNSLTNIYSFPNPMAMGSTNTSTTFSVSAGQCAYVVVDGFAGDACNYNLSLTNISGECKVLPVELIYFKAIESNKNAELGWATASETNNDFFTVMKSIDGIDFKEIINVKGAGNSAVYNEYKVVDNEINNSIVYYKLKQTDFDGKYIYSDVIPFYSTVINNISDLQTYWNSQNQSIELKFNGNTDFNYDVFITDIAGRVVYNSHLQIDSDNKAAFNFPTNNLQKGIYQLTVVSDNNMENRKLVVW